MELSPYQADPFFDRLLARGKAKRRMEIGEGPQVGDIGVSDSDGPTAPTGVSISTPVTTVTSDYEFAEPVYGVTESYGLANRAGEAISQNAPAIVASAISGGTRPLGQAAMGTAIDSILGDAPSYVTKESEVGGLQTQIGGFDPTKSYGRDKVTGVISEINAEDFLNDNITPLSAAEAQRMNPSGYIGGDPNTALGGLTNALISFASPMPFLGMALGPTVPTNVGTTMALGSGFLGPRAHEAQSLAEGNIRNNVPGNFGLKIGNTFVTYQATEGPLGLSQAKVIGRNMSKKEFETLYSGVLGYDPRTVDFKNSTGTDLKGQKLGGFVSGVGGFAEDGNFFNSRGQREYSPNMETLNSYAENAARDPATARAAVEALNKKAELSLNDFLFAESKHKTYKQVADKIATRAREMESKTVASTPIDASKGPVGAEAITSRNISDVITQDLRGQVPTTAPYERGESPAEVAKDERDYNQYAFESGEGSGISTAEGYTTVSGSPSETTDDDRAADETFFATGGFVQKKADGGAVEGMGPVGFVNGKGPSEVTPEKTVADDVEGAIPEGTFVISGAAVERAGEKYIVKLITDAIDYLNKKGIDISQSAPKMNTEEAVSVAVSEGEVLIPPVIARVIGYDRLEKINNRGEKEVQRRLEESQQQDPNAQHPQQMVAREGGFIQKADGGKVDPRRIIPHSEFKSFLSDDMRRNATNFLEVVGGYVTGTVDDMEKAYSYAENWGINNQADDRYRDTLRHGLVGGLYAGGPDDNVFKKLGSKAASYYADEKDRLAAINPEYEMAIREESAIDYNNNRYGRALRKAVGDEEAFVRAMEQIMDKMRKGEGAPYVTDEDGNKITLQLSTGK